MSHESLSSTGWAQKSLSTYILGFVLCLILTFISFGLVKFVPVSKNIIYVLLAALAIGQLIVQAICFLGLKGGKDGQSNLLPFLFTILIILFLAGGSLWIMHNLNALMIDSYLIAK